MGYIKWSGGRDIQKFTSCVLCIFINCISPYRHCIYCVYMLIVFHPFTSFVLLHTSRVFSTKPISYYIFVVVGGYYTRGNIYFGEVTCDFLLHILSHFIVCHTCNNCPFIFIRRPSVFSSLSLEDLLLLLLLCLLPTGHICTKWIYTCTTDKYFLFWCTSKYTYFDVFNWF